jgi:hypothetical protein
MIGVAYAQSDLFGAWVALRLRNAPLIAVIPKFSESTLNRVKIW